MLLDIHQSLPKNVIHPYSQQGRNYHLLFLRKAEGDFFVRNTPYQVENCLITLGEIFVKLDETRHQVIGNIFFAKAATRCEGTFLLAYSGLFMEQAQTKIPTDFNMELVLKEKGFQVFNQRNKATLIVSPIMRRTVRENLEI